MIRNAVKHGTVTMTALYDTDLAAWAREQADLARQGSLDRLDVANIAEELESIARAERRDLAAQICRLSVYLLKWCYRPDRRRRSDRRGILRCRMRIERLLEDSPSLAGDWDEIMATEWPRAVRWASDETRIAQRALPADCPWTRPELLDADFLPDED